MDRIDKLLSPEEREVVSVSQSAEAFCAKLHANPSPHRVGRNSHPFVRREAARLTQWNVWERLRRGVLLMFTLVWFVVPKADGGDRLIGDARPLNEQMESPPPFGLPGLHDVLSLMIRSQHMVELDLKNWFYQIPIAPALWRFFGARCGAAKFACKVLVMGWSWAPAIACAISRAVVRLFEPWAVVYVDNILVGARSLNALRSLLRRLRRVCDWLNIIVKAWPTPSHYVTFLGLQLDPRRKRWRLHPTWALKAHDLIQAALAHPTPLKARDWFRVIGVVVYAASMTVGCAVVWEVLSWASRLGRNIADGRMTWESRIVPWRRVRNRLQEFARNLKRNPWRKCPRIRQDITVFSDASDRGEAWIVCGRRRVARAWRPKDPATHIYHKELDAALDAIRFLLQSGIRNTRVHLYVDNEAVEGTLRRMYGPRPSINTSLASLANRMDEAEMLLCIHRVPSADNPADYYSRLPDIDPSHPLLQHEEPDIVTDECAFTSPCRCRRNAVPGTA